MSRQEKGSRIKGLPPFIRIQTLEATTGSFPTVSRTSVDNRTGRYFTPFNDLKTINYGPNIYSNLSLGAGLPTDSIYLDSELTTSIVVSGNIIPGVGDKWINQIPGLGQDLRPFDDSNHPAMDGMLRSLTSSSFNDFYATGSALQDAGMGFQQPLKDKTKIEIDLTPSSNHSFGITNFTSGSSSYAMAYYNKTTKTWNGIGSGIEPINYIGLVPGVSGATSYDALGKFLNEKAVGFGSVLDNGGTDAALLSSSFMYGNPIDTFGFPYHAKYSGSIDTTFNMNDYISEPFLLEKVVVYFSGSFARGGGIQGSFGKTLVTFFILNETKLNRNLITTNEHILTYLSGGSSVVEQQIVSSSLIYSSSRDLVTWLHIGGIVTGFADTESFVRNYASNKDKIIYSKIWSGQMIVSGVVKNPIQYQNGFLRTLNSGWPNIVGNNSLYCAEYRESWNFSGRSGAQKNFITKRNWHNVISSPRLVAVTSPSNARGQQYEVIVNESYQKNNPYILMPTDQLIFGWSISGHELGWNYSGADPVFSGSGPHLTFSNQGIHKVVLYGSHLRVGDDGELKEYHDTLNQLLTSNNIHETIGVNK